MNPGNDMVSQTKSIAILRDELQECTARIITLTESTSGDHAAINASMKAISAEAAHLANLIEEHESI